MAECADSTPTKSIERVCVSPSSKEQICLLCAKVVSNNDFRRKLTSSGGRKNKNLFQSRVNTGKGDFTTKESLTSAHIFKPTETFQYTHFSSCNPHRVRKGLIKGETLRLLRTNSLAKSLYENICNFKKRLSARGYPHNLIEKITSEVKVSFTKEQ